MRTLKVNLGHLNCIPWEIQNYSFNVFPTRWVVWSGVYFRTITGTYVLYTIFYCIRRNKNFYIMGLWKDTKDGSVQRDAGGRGIWLSQELCCSTGPLQINRLVRFAFTLLFYIPGCRNSSHSGVLSHLPVGRTGKFVPNRIAKNTECLDWGIGHIYQN